MVIFITNLDAYKEMEDIILSGNHPVWLSADILSREKIQFLWDKKIKLSVFDYAVNPDNKNDLECALQTIKEHHPGQNIWVQFENKI